MWNYHCAPMQIYLCSLIFPSHPLVSAETFPWHWAFTSKELGLHCGSEAEEERWQQSPLCWAQGGGLQMCEGLATPILCTGFTYMWCVSDTNSLSPSAQFIETWNILRWRGLQR